MLGGSEQRARQIAEMVSPLADIYSNADGEKAEHDADAVYGERYRANVLKQPIGQPHESRTGRDHADSHHSLREDQFTARPHAGHPCTAPGAYATRHTVASLTRAT